MRSLLELGSEAFKTLQKSQPGFECTWRSKGSASSQLQLGQLEVLGFQPLHAKMRRSMGHCHNTLQHVSVILHCTRDLETKASPANRGQKVGSGRCALGASGLDMPPAIRRGWGRPRFHLSSLRTANGSTHPPTHPSNSIFKGVGRVGSIALDSTRLASLGLLMPWCITGPRREPCLRFRSRWEKAKGDWAPLFF